MQHGVKHPCRLKYKAAKEKVKADQRLVVNRVPTVKQTNAKPDISHLIPPMAETICSAWKNLNRGPMLTFAYSGFRKWEITYLNIEIKPVQ